MNRLLWSLIGIVLLGLMACKTEDAADEEFYYAEAKGEYSLATSYQKRAQYAREKQVEYLVLAEEQEERLRNLRAEIAVRRADNDKRAKQVQGLKKEAADLANAVKTATKTKNDSVAAKNKLAEEIETEKAAITKLKSEIAALKAERKKAEDEEKAVKEAFGIK